MKISMRALRVMIKEELEEVMAVSSGNVTFAPSDNREDECDCDDELLWDDVEGPNRLKESLTDSEEDEVEELVRQPEYKSIEAFVDWKMSDADAEIPEFSHLDVWALSRKTGNSIKAVADELLGYGMHRARREPAKNVRGFKTSSNDRWFGPGSLKTHGGAGIDTSTGRATVRGKTV